MMFKVKVFASHKPIGWLRNITVDGRVESVLSPNLARASRFDEAAENELALASLSMATFHGPERDDPKKPNPPVTFQMVRI